MFPIFKKWFQIMQDEINASKITKTLDNIKLSPYLSLILFVCYEAINLSNLSYNPHTNGSLWSFAPLFL